MRYLLEKNSAITQKFTFRNIGKIKQNLSMRLISKHKPI